MKGITFGNREFSMNKDTKNDLDFVFIEDEGTWFLSKEDADKGHYKTGNEVGLHFAERVLKGIVRTTTVYQQRSTNVWN
jgi:hypothetical protein